MKKRIKSVLALLLALTMVIAGNMTVFAADDGCYRPENPNNDYVGGTTIGGDDGGSGSSDSGSSSSSNSGGSSSSSSSSESSGGGSYDSGSSYDGGGSYDAGSGNSGSTYSAPAPKVAGSKATAGKQEFRAVASAANGTYKVIHCGTEKMVFTLKGADGKAAACDGVALRKRDDDGKYAINYTVKDAKGMTVGAPLDRTYMYNELGVSYVTINDTVIIDIEAEAAAKAAK